MGLDAGRGNTKLLPQGSASAMAQMRLLQRPLVAWEETSSFQWRKPAASFHCAATHRAGPAPSGLKGEGAGAGSARRRFIGSS